MTDKQTEELHKALFVNLVLMLGSMAMQQLGKLVDPSTQKPTVDLKGAQAMIDMLSMLQTKTVGNLSEQEAKMLKDTLSSLQLTYVETSAEQNGEASQGEEAESAEKAPAQEPEATVESKKNVEPSSDSGEHHARYHKSYGEQ